MTGRGRKTPVYPPTVKPARGTVPWDPWDVMFASDDYVGLGSRLQHGFQVLGQFNTVVFQLTHQLLRVFEGL